MYIFLRRPILDLKISLMFTLPFLDALILLSRVVFRALTQKISGKKFAKGIWTFLPWSMIQGGSNISRATCNINNKSTWNVLYNWQKIDVKCVWNNRHKSINNMIHIDNTHACINVQWTYLQVRYLHIQTFMHMYTFNSPFQVQTIT